MEVVLEKVEVDFGGGGCLMRNKGVLGGDGGRPGNIICGFWKSRGRLRRTEC